MSMLLNFPRASSQQKTKEETSFLDKKQLIALKSKENSFNGSTHEKDYSNKENSASNSLFPAKFHYEIDSSHFSMQKLKKDFKTY